MICSKSMCLSDSGSWTLRSAFRGRRDSVRLFSATPPAIPASAAPPAINGVLAFEANSATFPPALLTAPFELLLLARAVVERARELDGLDEALRARVLEPLRPRVLADREPVFLDLLDEPFRLVDLLDLELPRFERELEDRVV
jgi:hypothetical protein